MKRPRLFCLWLFLLSLVLPLMEFIAFSFIYSTFIKLAVRISAAYIPISIISAFFVLYLMMSTRHKNSKKHIFAFYLVSMCLFLAVSVLLRERVSLLLVNILGGVVLLGGTFFAYLTRPRNSSFTYSKAVRGTLGLF